MRTRMKTNVLWFFLLLAPFLGPSSPAHAVDLLPPSPRQGYYLSAGPHLALLQVWDEGATMDPVAGSMFGLRLGQMLTSRLGLGMTIVEVSSGETNDHETLMVGLFALEGQIRLWRMLALHAGSGLGFVEVKEKVPANPDDATDGAYGAYTMLGLSYDFFPYRKPVSGGLALSPALRARFIPASPLDTLAVTLGVEVTWWTGLPKNQLDLPPDRAF